MDEIFKFMDKNNFDTIEYEKKLENLYENYKYTLKENNINIINNNNNKIKSKNKNKLFNFISNQIILKNK